MKISLNIHLDGLPLFKSSKDELWPILFFNIQEYPRIKPMVIGVYHGKSKASSLEAFFTPLVDELDIIMKNGIIVNNYYLTGGIRCFICASPARAFIKGKKNFLYRNF